MIRKDHTRPQIAKYLLRRDENQTSVNNVNWYYQVFQTLCCHKQMWWCVGGVVHIRIRCMILLKQNMDWEQRTGISVTVYFDINHTYWIPMQQLQQSGKKITKKKNTYLAKTNISYRWLCDVGKIAAKWPEIGITIIQMRRVVFRRCIRYICIMGYVFWSW